MVPVCVPVCVPDALRLAPESRKRAVVALTVNRTRVPDIPVDCIPSRPDLFFHVFSLLQKRCAVVLNSYQR